MKKDPKRKFKVARLQKLLKELGACGPAITWCKGKTLAEAWAQCERVDWMWWLLRETRFRPGWAHFRQISKAFGVNEPQMHMNTFYDLKIAVYMRYSGDMADVLRKHIQIGTRKVTK